MSIFRKIGRILLLVGGIFELLAMGFCFLVAIGGFVVGAGFASTIMPDNEVVVIAAGVGGGVLFLIFAVLCLIAGVIGIKGFKAHTKGNYIANIVFGVLTGLVGFLLLAGGVLGLLALRKEKKEQPAEEQPAEEAAE